MKKELEKIASQYSDALYKKERKKRRNTIIKNLCVDYAQSSTLHGLGYMSSNELSLFEKLFWLTTFSVSFGLCAYLIGNVYQKWTNSPVIVTVSERLVSVNNVPFPSITICPQIKSKAGIYNFGNKLEDYKLKKFNESEEAMFKDISMLCNHPIDSDRNITNSSLADHIKRVSPSISYTFDSCYWQHEKTNCLEMFEKVYTADGVCYNINGIAASEMFRDSVQKQYRYTDRIRKSQGWSLENGFTKSDPNYYPKRGNKNHASPDLEVFLRSKERDGDRQCNGLKSGYEIYLHHPADFPQTSLYRYSAVNDKVTSLAVSVHLEDTSKQLIGYSPEVRQCYFLKDRYLRYFQNYTQKNCEAECVSNYTYELCGCMGFYMPHNDSSRICAENKKDCVRKAYDLMAQRELSLENESKCSCRPACHSIEYDAEVLTTNFVTENFNGRKGRFIFFGFGRFDTSYNISKVEVYFKKPHFITTSRSEVFGTTDFLANIGGLLGVFLGFSFLSVVEIFYFFTLKLGVALKREQEKNIMLKGDTKHKHNQHNENGLEKIDISTIKY